jgi:hypothetical protein
MYVEQKMEICANIARNQRSRGVFESLGANQLHRRCCVMQMKF